MLNDDFFENVSHTKASELPGKIELILTEFTELQNGIHGMWIWEWKRTFT